MYFHYFVIISPWKRAWNFICSNLNPLPPMMLCVKFGWNWLSGSGEEDENVKSLQTDGKKDREMDRQTTDGRWSVKLTTASSLSELKRKFEIYILLDILIKNKDHNLKFISNQHSVTTPRPSKKAKISLKIDTILLKSGNISVQRVSISLRQGRLHWCTVQMNQNLGSKIIFSGD